MTESNYFLHRISHEGNVSYSLLDMGYLTLGWSKFTDSDILEAAREEGYPRFNPITNDYGESHNRSRWGMWYFARMNVGDKIVVPLYDGLFSVYEVEERAKGINELKTIVQEFKGSWDNHRIIWRNNRLFDESSQREIDLGFFIKVKPIVKDVFRNYVTGKLVSRMKIQYTNADINDIKEHVETAIKVGKTGKPVSLYEESLKEFAQKLKKQMSELLDDTRFEKLIKWYIEKSGAEYSKIPAKNEPGKKDGADADIVAEFKNLKHIIYIQAKHHNDKTSDWAVHQINEYYNQKAEGDSDYSYAKWVISTCDDYSEEAKKLANEYNVRLIDGEEFARMLLDVGLLGLDEAF